ncbi:MAG: ATP-binding protein, partial [Gemmatimonadaceae bacterium]|nr:ATP-binding protein [Gemmatimonadaceae bacterium]
RRTIDADLPPGEILGLLADDPSDILVSADSGLFRVTNGRTRSLNSLVHLPPGTRPREMVRDPAGRLYLGRPGLTIVHGDTVRHYGAAQGLSDAYVRAIHPRGAYTWIGTADSGLFVLHDGRITPLGRHDPRLHREVLAITSDAHGYLWLAWSYGLMRVAREDLEAVARGEARPIALQAFDQADGLPASAFAKDFQTTVSVDTAGRLHFANAAGVVRVDPSAWPVRLPVPTLLVESMAVDGRPTAPHASPTLAPGVGRVEFTFAVTNARRPKDVRVQYRLLGVDSAWTDAGTRRTVAFGPLGAGRYRFEVRAAPEDGRWYAMEVPIPFTVAPRIGERVWFLPALLASAILGAGVVARMRQRALEQRGRALQRLVDERTADLEATRQSLERRVEERTAELASELAERTRLEAALVQSQKLEGLGRLAGGVAHEINNSMTSVLGFTDLAASAAEGNGTVLAELAEVRRAGERVAAITRQLLIFARRQQSTRAVLDLAGVLRDLERTLGQTVGDTRRLVVEVADDLPMVRADRAQVEQVVLNLVLNARDATASDGTVTVTLTRRFRDQVATVGGVELLPGDYAVLAVMDTGEGITDAVRQRLFEPFFTTKAIDRGTGMGLAVCHGIVVQHAGAIEVTSTPGQGATFAVWLPASAEEEPGLRPGASPVEAGTDATATVLVVDDEPMVREMVRRVLTAGGHRVLVADDGHAALALVDGATPGVDVLLTDFLMPGLTGIELVRALRARGLEMPVIFMSGFVGHDEAVERELAAIGPVLGKPFTGQMLRAAVATALRSALTTGPRADRGHSAP